MKTQPFRLHSPFAPTGDQPDAIAKLTAGFEAGMKYQTLLGVTGSGKTFTMANVIANLNRPTLILSHNKTLAAQLCTEFREFFPENAVEYFVSYYDYYQPEAYVPGKDMYIEKDALINDEIDKLRHSATSALFERRDVIIVSSVVVHILPRSAGRIRGSDSRSSSGTGGVDAGAYGASCVNQLRAQRHRLPQRPLPREGRHTRRLSRRLHRKAVRIEFFGDEIDRVCEFNPLRERYSNT